MNGTAPRRFTFPRRQRLSGRRAYAAVYDARLRKSAGPLAAWARPNDLGHLRLGLAVPRRVGTAVRRNRIKRLLREAFRLGQHAWPRGYDVVVQVRPHPAAELPAYQAWLAEVVASLDAGWRKRRGRAGEARDRP